MKTEKKHIVFKESNYALRYLIAIFIFSFLFSTESFSQKIIAGYYPDWLKYDLPISKLELDDLTHILHAFAWPNENGEIEFYAGMLDSNLNAAVHQAGKKILLSFGGASLSSGFAPMVKDSIKRTKFVDAVYWFLTTNNYDGIDIDWEFPQNEEETNGLTKLVHELREIFDKHNSSMLITIAVGSSNWSCKHFDLEKMRDDLDWIGMMGYDMTGEWSSFAGLNAPLYKGRNGWAWDDGYRYLKFARKIPNDKLVLGMPFYGKHFYAPNLYAEKTDTVVTDLFYNKVEELIATNNWDYFWDNSTKVPYLLNKKRTEFITYDDTTSVKEKVRYTVNKNVAGVMIWALGQDIIGDAQPLLKTLANTMRELTDIKEQNNQVPKDYKLFNNYPNPFNPVTVIKYQIPQKEYVRLKVYNSLGMLVKVLVNEEKDAGIYTVEFSGENCTSGVYFYDLNTTNCRLTNKMILLK